MVCSIVVERRDPGVLSEHEDAASGLQVGFENRPEHIGGAVQSQTDASVV